MQTYPHIEHLIMDAESTDGSVDILSQCPDLRWCSEKDSGQSAALNKALARSRGEIIGWVNSDDGYYGRYVVEDAVRVFSQRPKVDVLYGHAALVDECNHVIRLSWA